MYLEHDEFVSFDLAVANVGADRREIFMDVFNDELRRITR